MSSKVMNPTEYWMKTNRPNAFRNDVLNESLEILKANNAKEVPIIQSSLKCGKIQKPKILPPLPPPNHYEFFWVECSAEEAKNIANYLFKAEASAAPKSGESTPVSNRFAELADFWTTLSDHL
jgi:hypothetical protein